MSTSPATTHIHEELGAIGETPPAGILSRTLHTEGPTKVVLFQFAAGEELSEHTSSRPAFIHVLSGDMDITLGETHITGGPGTWIAMEPGTRHALIARTPAVMLLTLLAAGEK